MKTTTLRASKNLRVIKGGLHLGFWGWYANGGGVTDQAKWSCSMFYKFGEPIRPRLALVCISAHDDWRTGQATGQTNPPKAFC
jgi:hypothetical protein